MHQMARRKRKLEKSTKRIEEESLRKSPRVSAALEGAWKAHRPRHVTVTRPSSCPLKMAAYNNGQSQGHGHGPASRTRSRKKRKLIRPLHQVSPKQGGEEPTNDDHQANTDLLATEQSNSKPQIPEKRVLEKVLDVLQRRDIHEIFAEPVDPEEVEEYYEIIKEPMDFGTMRAKLHEGMYRNLDQFERDVFFITKNAMHFNSSGTIYFRQARAIDELAVKVFHVLKTHPENFEMEFRESRRRNTRKPQCEAQSFHNRTHPKMARNAKCNSSIIDGLSKSTPSSMTTSSNVQRRNAARHGCSGSVPCSSARNHKVSRGVGDDRVPRSIELDRRCTYKSRMPLLGKDESIISTLSTNKNQLERVIQQDIGYRESLMLFVKDLGPVVQKIAQQKLLDFLVQNCQIPITSNNSSHETGDLDRSFTAPISQKFKDFEVQRHPIFSTRTDIEDNDSGERTSIDGKIAEVSKTDFSNKKEIGQVSTISGFCFNNKVHDDQSINTLSHSFSLAPAGESSSSSSFAGLKNTGSKSTPLIDKAKLDNRTRSSEIDLANRYLKLSEFKLTNTDGSSFSQSEALTSSLSLGFMKQGDRGKAKQGLIHLTTSSAEAGQAMTIDRCKSLGAPFGQLSTFGQRTFLQQSSTTAVNFFDI